MNRNQLRQKRRQLSRQQQRQAECKLCSRVRDLSAWRSATKIGIYLHAFGEIATHQLILLAFKQSKQVYLPQICRMNQRLLWVRISLQQYQNQRFYKHRLGMYEPMQRGIQLKRLDLLCLPLLAADRLGNRLGMGGGFYDRTLAQAVYRPYRLGLAHDFQLLNTPLNPQKWDQALDALACPNTVLGFKRSSHR